MRWWLIGSVVLAGCATSLPASENVTMVSSPASVATCRLLGEVRGDQNMVGGVLAEMAKEDAIAQLKNKTEAMGGNAVLVERSSVGWAGANMAGKAYKCEAAAPS